MSDQFPGPGDQNPPPSWGQPSGSVPPPPPGMPTPGMPGMPAPGGQWPQMGMGMGMPGIDMAGMNKKATTNLILAIVGLLCCFIASIVGLVQATSLKKEAAAAGVEEPSNNKIARIIAIVAIVLWVLGLILQFAVLGSSTN